MGHETIMRVRDNGAGRHKKKNNIYVYSIYYPPRLDWKIYK